MRRRHLLFVTYQNERYDDGLSYAIDLAKTLNKDLSVLMVPEKKGLSEKFSDMMAAAAFAEAGEHDTAREMMSGVDMGILQKRMDQILEKCHRGGVMAGIFTSPSDAVPAVRKFIAEQGTVEMVLLGPGATEDGNVSAKDLNRLVKTATRPVITITRHANVA